MLDCYGWEPFLDDNSDPDQDSAMPDDAQGKISHDTRRMMDQQFGRPNHNSVDKDFNGLGDTLNGVLKRLGDTVASNPAAQGTGAPQMVHVEGAPYDPFCEHRH
jgi:hypothetical protein